jgi:hypothetical protein
VRLPEIKENDFQGASEAWEKGQDDCIRSLGNYFKRYGSQN